MADPNPNTTSTLDGLFKLIYADRLKNLIPDHSMLVRDIKFSKDKRLGKTYEQPVVLTNEHGITYAAAGAGAFALAGSIPMTTQNASVPSVQKLGRSQIDYEAASKASEGGPGSKRAFRKSTELVVKNMMDSMYHRVESSILYGGVGIGTTSSSANASATQTVVTLTDATWAVGMWAGAENARLNFYNSTTCLGNTDYTNADAIFTVAAVSVTNKTITVNGTATGITALDSAISSSASNVKVYWYSSYGTNNAYGMDYQLTTSGSVFGINNSTYHLWKGNSYDMGGAVAVDKLLESTTDAVGKGLNKDAKCYLAPKIFADLNGIVAGYRRHDSSYKNKIAEIGNSNIKLYAQHGMLEVVPHPMVKQGEAFVLPLDCCKRIGSTDVTFNNPGTGGRFFRELNDNAGFELRIYTDQSFFIDRPSICTKITGITSS
jgi:hypothetical protein